MDLTQKQDFMKTAEPKPVSGSEEARNWDLNPLNEICSKSHTSHKPLCSSVSWVAPITYLPWLDSQDGWEDQMRRSTWKGFESCQQPCAYGCACVTHIELKCSQDEHYIKGKGKLAKQVYSSFMILSKYLFLFTWLGAWSNWLYISLKELIK